MAVISCPECGKEVSDRAVSCPKCGYPIRDQNVGEQDEGIQEQHTERVPDQREREVEDPAVQPQNKGIEAQNTDKKEHATSRKQSFWTALTLLGISRNTLITLGAVLCVGIFVVWSLRQVETTTDANSDEWPLTRGELKSYRMPERTLEREQDTKKPRQQNQPNWTKATDQQNPILSEKEKKELALALRKLPMHKQEKYLEEMRQYGMLPPRDDGVWGELVQGCCNAYLDTLHGAAYIMPSLGIPGSPEALGALVEYRGKHQYIQPPAGYKASSLKPSHIVRTIAGPLLVTLHVLFVLLVIVLVRYLYHQYNKMPQRDKQAVEMSPSMIILMIIGSIFLLSQWAVLYSGGEWGDGTILHQLRNGNIARVIGGILGGGAFAVIALIMGIVISKRKEGLALIVGSAVTLVVTFFIF